MSSEREMKEEEECHGWAARDASGFLSPYNFGRSDDVSLKITHCGVCYADVIATRNKFGRSKYPVVPGHEIVGIVKEVGSNVRQFKVGDHVGVGTYVNSCRDCEYCGMDMDNYCSKGPVGTINHLDVDGTITKGGYSSHIVVHERDKLQKKLHMVAVAVIQDFSRAQTRHLGPRIYEQSKPLAPTYCSRIPNDYPLALAAPLLCAGITVYSPMMRHKMNQPGKSLGVIGLGGLGHLAVKFGKAFGLSITVFSTSISKKDEALSKLGADRFVISSDEEQMKAMANSLNFIINTASGDHPFDQYLSLLTLQELTLLATKKLVAKSRFLVGKSYPRPIFFVASLVAN
ncbi:unnamed protein product [Camellia sinensis]